MSSVCSQQTFKWSEQEFQLKELVEYKHLLPFPVLVTQGYAVEHEEHLSVSLEEVYWIYDIIDHPSILVQNEDATEFKIPQCYDVMVVPIQADGKEGQEFPFKDIRSRGGFKYFKFSDPIRKVTTKFDEESKKFCLGELEIVDVIDDNYLVVHSVFMENLTRQSTSGPGPDTEVVHPGFHLLPASVPICVSIGLGLNMAPDAIYFHTMAELKGVADSYTHNYDEKLKLAAGIVLVQKDEAARLGEYDYIDMTKGTNQPQKIEEHPEASKFRIPINLRNEPIVMARDIHPVRRLSQMKLFYDTGDMGDAKTNVDDLDENDYLEPITWLAMERASAAKKQQYGDTEAVYDDVFVTSEPVLKPTSVGCDKDKARGGEVTWLRNRFQKAAKPAEPNNNHPKPPSVHTPSTPTGASRHQSVSDIVNALQCKTGSPPMSPNVSLSSSPTKVQSSTPASPVLKATPPALPRRLSEEFRGRPDSGSEKRGDWGRPAWNNRRQSTTGATSGRDSLPNIQRKHSVDAGRTAIVCPMPSGNSNNSLMAELRKKFSPGSAQFNTSGYQPQKAPSRRITKLSDVPQDITHLSVDDISDCLSCLQLSMHAAAMRAGMVDGGLLLCLGEEDLKCEFGFTDFNAKKLMQFAKHGWRPRV